MMYLTKIVEHLFTRNNLRQYCLHQLSFTAILANLQVVQHVWVNVMFTDSDDIQDFKIMVKPERKCWYDQVKYVRN